MKLTVTAFFEKEVWGATENNEILWVNALSMVTSVRAVWLKEIEPLSEASLFLACHGADWTCICSDYSSHKLL
ncbi:MAG: hypothetical protein WCD89_14975 [Anaerocolumna sp.]